MSTMITANEIKNDFPYRDQIKNIFSIKINLKVNIMYKDQTYILTLVIFLVCACFE